MNNRRSKVAAVIAGLILGVCAASAEATPIAGSFSITGNYRPVDGSTGAAALLQFATGIDFISLVGGTSTPGVPGSFLVNSASGDFAAAGLQGATGEIRDFAFSGPGSANYPTAPPVILDFQSVSAGLASFDLSALYPVVYQSANFLLLSGTGTFHLTGFDPTPGIFDFSANGFGGTFSFSASEGAISVPEPSSILLLVTGLVMGARKRSAILGHEGRSN